MLSHSRASSPLYGLLRVVAVLPFLLLFWGCPEDVPTTPEPPSHNETVLESTTATIGPAGGTVALSDGMSVTVEPGASGGTIELTVRKIGSERFFDAPNRLAYDVVPSSAARMTIIFPGAPGRDADHIGVFRYDPESQEGTEPPFGYDPATGRITVIVEPGRINGNGTAIAKRSIGEANRWVVESDPLVEPQQDKVELSMPYYEQDDKTCWATTTKMLSTAYNSAASYQIPYFLKELNTDHQQGISHLTYWNSLPDLVSKVTGGTASAIWYWRAAPAREKLVELLDKDIPVSMSLNLPDHSVLVIGYKRTITIGGKFSYEFLIHDPGGASMMNTWQPWSWFENRKPVRFSFQLVWLDKSPPADRPLQTVGLPLSNTGAVRWVRPFIDCDGITNYRSLSRLTFRNEAPRGYDWSSGGDAWFEALPGDGGYLSLELPLWNAHPTAQAHVDLYLKLARKGSQGFTYYESLDTTLPAQRKTVDVIRRIPLRDRSTENPTEYILTVELVGAAGKLDGWTLEFTTNPALPTIFGLDPCNAGRGSEVTVTGIGFGNNYNPNTDHVIFDQQPATEVISWNDSVIVVKVPAGAASGDVYVVSEGRTGNGVFFDVEGDKLTYTLKGFSLNKDDIFFGPVTCSGSVSADDMVIDDDNVLGSIGEILTFSITGSPPRDVLVKFRVDGIHRSKTFVTSDTTYSIETFAMKDYVLEYTRPDGGKEKVYSTDGNFTITLEQSTTLQPIADGFWKFEGSIYFRYTSRWDEYMFDALVKSTTYDHQTDLQHSLVLLGFLSEH